MPEERLTSLFNYKTTNSAGVVTINASIEIADQSPQSASALLLALLNAAGEAPKAQLGR